MLIIFGVVGLNSPSVWAADTGMFLFLNATPQPVFAGETVQFSVVTINQGTENWDKPRTYLEAEIYDANKKYLGKTDRLRPTTDTAPGKSLTATLSYRLPVTYAGDYYFRVLLVHNDQRVIQSEDKLFSINARSEAETPKQTRPVTLGGNVVVSYKNDNGPSDYSGNTSVNLSGLAYSKPFDFSLNTFYSGGVHQEIQSVLFNYYGAYVDLGLGDVSPSFSPLSVSGSGMRGAHVKSKNLKLGSVGWEMSVVGAQTAEPKEGTTTQDGVFRRMLYGTQSNFTLPGNVTLRANFVQVADSQSSISTAGPTLAPAKNKSAGGGATWQATNDLKWEMDYQRSSFEADVNSSTPAVTDSAWRTSLAFTQPKWNAATFVERTGSNFTSLAAPGITKDRMTYDFKLGLTPVQWFNLINSFNQYKDDLNNDPAKVATTQRVTSSQATFNLPTQTTVNTGFSVNSAVGSPSTTQDNRTVTYSAGLSQGWKGQSFSSNVQSNRFKNRARTSNDLRTDTWSNSLNLVLNPRVSAALGATHSNTHDLGDGSVLKTLSLSASSNFTLIADKLVTQLFVSQNNSEDDDTASRSKRVDTNINLDLTWKITPKFSTSLGLSETTSKDKITSSNNTTVDSVNIKTAYSF